MNVNLRMCLTASRVWLGLNFPVFGEVSGVRISYLRIKSVEANSLSLVIFFSFLLVILSLMCLVYFEGSSPLEELVKRPPVSETSSSHSHILLQPEVLYLVHHLTYAFNWKITWDL